MGDSRYTSDEKEFGHQDVNDAGASRATGSDGRAGVAGFKKLGLLLLVAVIICCFRSYVLTRSVVSGDSMNPTFSDGDVLWTRVFDVEDLSRYRVVVADINRKLLIKRVIGLPGETVQIIEGFVHINGERLDNDYGYQTTVYGCAEQAVALGENEYFLMGDNRDNSMDSRQCGAVKIRDIEGVVVFRFFPFWKIGAVQ